MIDKGKYASHGAFIKRLPAVAVGQHHKPKLAVIHPLPSNAPRVPAKNNQLQGVVLQSKTYSAKFRFQEDVEKKPVAQQLIQPFLYIEKVIKKQKVDEKLANIKRVEPFITSTNMRPRKTKKDSSLPVKKAQTIPAGFKNLYDYEEQKRVTANKLFQKMLDANVHNLRDMFMLWVGKNRKLSPEIQIKEQQFVDFIKEVLPGKIAQKQIRRFFELYRNPAPNGKEKDEAFRTISIKPLGFNYDKFYKNQTEVINIISQKALKQRYIWLKNYLKDFDESYPDLKQAMKSIKQYEESLKNHFKQLYQAYRNPYQQEIENLQRELEKPIIKYDKLKKNELNHRIETLTAKHEELHSQLTQDFHNFMEQYEAAILPNHDLFFTKRELCKLLIPALDSRPTLTRSHIQEQVSIQQTKKEQFLECLSQLVMELDRDKKHLGEDSFTLDEVVQMVLMKGRKKQSRFSPEFIVYASKKLIKQVKRQFLLKHQLAVQSLEAFPADQQISMDLLHTCFEMQCSKVLLKNQIWQQLLGFIPSETPQQSRLHQYTIQGNLCLELSRRYFSKLDERIKVELNKSKQISLYTENVTLEDFGRYANLVEGVINQINDYVEEDQEEEADKVQPLQDHRRVTFADIVDQSLQQHNFPEKAKEEAAQRQEEQNLVKALLKSIFQEDTQQPQQPHPQQLVSQLVSSKIREPTIAENLQDMNSLAKSIFEAEALNTNSFDIRYFEKEKEKTKDMPLGTEVVRLGSSILLSNLPQVEELNSPDPLKISRLLMTTIDQGIQQERKLIKEQALEKSIVEGVNSHYYDGKIKLQNKPTIYDSQGKSKYSVLLPIGYYQDFVAAENVPDNQKWYLRPHHVETLTENPLSKKDNVIHTEYQSKLDKIPLKKRPDEYVIQQNVQRKTELIDSLEQRLAALRKDLATAQRGSRAEGAKVPPAVVDKYMSKLLESKEDKDLEVASYQAVLYDLRRNERSLLNKHREKESFFEGDPGDKWWQRKDKGFNIELRKERLLASEEVTGQTKHRQYVDKLKNQQIY